MAKEETEVKKEGNERYSVAEIATQTDLVILDAESKEQLTIHTALVKILNNLEKLKKLL